MGIEGHLLIYAVAGAAMAIVWRLGVGEPIRPWQHAAVFLLWPLICAIICAEQTAELVKRFRRRR